MVDGLPQCVKGNAPIIGFSDNADAPHTIVDMTPVYEAQLEQAHRGVQLVDKSVLVQDDLRTLDHAASVRWGMATNAEVTIADAHTATLRQDGRTMTLRVLSPEEARLEVRDMENPPRDYDAKNPNTRMICFESGIAPSSAATLAVFLSPGESQADIPARSPLTDW